MGMRLTRLALWPVTAAAAAATLAMARAHPDGSFAGRSVVGAAAELAPVLTLGAAGLLFWGSRPRNPIGPLLVAAALAWLLPEWTNAEAGSALLFTLGLIGSFACVALVVHVALAYPGGHLRSVFDKGAVALAYSGAFVVIGLVPALVFDPRGEGCTVCPRNLALVHGDAALNEDLGRLGIRVAIGWTLIAVLAIALRALRGSRPALRSNGPVLAAAAACIGLANAQAWHSAGRAFIVNDAADVRLWRWQAAALAVLGASVAWRLFRARRMRRSVAQLVIELGHAPRAGGARDTLAVALGDPDLQLAYRRANGDGYVDVDGRPVPSAIAAGRAATPLLRDGREIAIVIHSDELLSDPGQIEDATTAARLAVENEQLQAEVRAQTNEIRASRARIVETADAERKRLERDLHDGAQQRLVALTLGLRLLRGEAERSGDAQAIDLLDEADRELRLALAELREVAHGIYPAVLGEDGVAAALETLAERLPATVRVGRAPDERFAAPVEAAAYFAAAEIVRDLGEHDGSAQIDVVRSDEELVVEVERIGAIEDADERLVEIADRVGALDGEIDVEAGPNGRIRMRARIPCA
ncbi:MAG TPA: histidine kinase [Thermoleophilaceae bacterium]